MVQVAQREAFGGPISSSALVGFEAILDTMNQGLVVFDDQLIILACNERAAGLLDVPRELLMTGAGFDAIIWHAAQRGDYGPGDLEQLVEKYIAIASSREAYCFERQRPDGTVLEITGNPLPGGGFVTTYTDITEHKQTEVALSESERRVAQQMELLDTTLKSMDEGVMVCDNELRILFCNDKVRELFELPQDVATVGSPFSSYLHFCAENGMLGRGDTAELVRDKEVSIAQTQRIRLTRTMPAGKVLEIRRNPMSDGGFVMTFSDITKHRRIQADLAESQRRYQDFAQASGDWVWEMDAELRFRYFSPNVQKVTGLAPEWHYGKTREDLLGDGYDQQIWADHLQTLQDCEPFRDFVYRRVGPGAEPQWLSSSGSPVFAADGRFLGYRGVGSDVTAQKEAEIALREAKENAETAANLARAATSHRAALLEELSATHAELETAHSHLEQELNQARDMQEALLPGPKYVQNVENAFDLRIASHFAPSSLLGGDYWGMIPIDDDRLGLTIADFSGHGVNAAMNTFRLHTLLRQFGPDPDDAALYLQRLNAALGPLLPTGQFATMLCGIINTASDIFEYAPAAAPTPLVYLPGEKKLIAGENAGIPLGVVSEPNYQTLEIPFPPGAVLFLYSDALIESPDRDGVMLGEEGLAKQVTAHLQSESPETLTQSIVDTFNESTDGPPPDDLTVLSFWRQE